MAHAVLIEDLAIILCIAGLVAVLFQKIQQPPVLGYLIAGLIIGPYTPPFSFIDDEAEIRILAELGVIFLMFSLGLEFSFKKMTKVGTAAVIIGIFEVVLMSFIGFGTGHLLGMSQFESILLGAALSISSTTIIIKALEDLNLKKHDFAELMIGVLLVEDLLAILLMVFVSTSMSTEDIVTHSFIWSTIKLLAVIASWFLIGYFALPYLMRKIQHYSNHETLTILSTGLCLFLSCIAIYFNYSAALGGFIMGSILAETPQVRRIEMLTLPIRDVFAAVFFVSVGMLIDPLVIIQEFPSVVILSIVTIVGKIVASGIGSLISGQKVSTSLKIGFGMAQIGEFSFIIIGLGGALSTTGASLYPLVVAVAAVTTFATPYLMRFSLSFSEQIAENLPAKMNTAITKYHHWLTHFRPQGKQALLQVKDVFRLFINGIIVFLICIFTSNIFIPRIFPMTNELWIFELLVWLTTLILASPFIWSMLFAKAISKQSTFKVFSWIFTCSELFFLIFPHLTFPLNFIPLTILLILHFKLNFTHLQAIYNSLEKRLSDNLTKRREGEDDLFQRFAPWDYELVRMQVSDRFPFIGQSLDQCRLRSFFGIYILAIKRDSETLWIPHSKEKIQVNDELIVLGNKEEIDQFKDFTQRMESLS